MISVQSISSLFLVPVLLQTVIPIHLPNILQNLKFPPIIAPSRMVVIRPVKGQILVLIDDRVFVAGSLVQRKDPGLGVNWGDPSAVLKF